MQINVYNTTNRKDHDRQSICRLVRKVLKDEGKVIATVNIIIVDGKYMKHLNDTYLNKKRTTNVISFDMGDVSEIYVCDDMARDSYELKYLILHGLLHLLGYDHSNEREGEEMHSKCAEYLGDE